MSAQVESNSVPRSRARRCAAWTSTCALRALACCGALALVERVFFDVSRVTTGSMAPALRGEDEGPPDSILIETCLTAGAAPPRRFQVVAFTHPELGMLIAKRVVGFEGEAIEVTRQGKLVVDGVTFDPPEGAGRGQGYLACGNLHGGDGPFVVPPGHVYVLGDDSLDSDDSRFWGALPVRRIRGRVLLRVWPPSRMAGL